MRNKNAFFVPVWAGEAVMGEWLPAPQAPGGEDDLQEAEGEVEVADGVEAPDPPFEDDPEHEDDTANENRPLCKLVFFEKQISRSQLGDAVQEQQHEARRDEVPEENVRPGHLRT